MKERTCCFTGHRKIPTPDMPRLKLALEKAIIKKIEEGVLYFGAGGALGFDTLAAQTVIDLRGTYPDIKLILVLPCPDQDKFWSEQERAIYADIKEKADKITYVEPSYTRYCMHKRNRHLVDNSAHCICYLREPVGGTAYTVSYATKKGLDIINLAN